jgi:hypothetical protein
MAVRLNVTHSPAASPPAASGDQGSLSVFPFLTQGMLLAVVKRDRQLMIDQANAAETPRQIKAASEALYSWLAEHPDDVVAINKIGDLIATRAGMSRINKEWR